jgi:signal transduction histidine kinase
MQYRELFRTTAFRLTMLYGLIFAVGTIALLGMVYVRSGVYLTDRVDGILHTEIEALMRTPRPGLRERIIEDLTLNGDRINVFGLFAANGERLAGNLDELPASLTTDGRAIELPSTPAFPVNARMLARRLPSDEILVVGRDVNQLREMRAIITSALVWSGVSILGVGLACGTVLSIAPLKRVRRLQTVAKHISDGDLHQRMPTSARGDELDMFATTLNQMLEEVERLMSEVKANNAIIAHDLLNPLANVAQKLRRLQNSAGSQSDEIAHIGLRIEEVLERFRALLRIAELESRNRRAGFVCVDLADVISPAEDLYGPLAEDAGVRFLVVAQRGTTILADPNLLFEAVSNLIDNAIKFGGRGSTVEVRAGQEVGHPTIIVQDNGPGIARLERDAVVRPFYRAERQSHTPGFGLGLSAVAAIVRLHGFELLLEDAEPGLRAVIDIRPVTGHVHG